MLTITTIKLDDEELDQIDTAHNLLGQVEQLMTKYEIDTIESGCEAVSLEDLKEVNAILDSFLVAIRGY